MKTIIFFFLFISLNAQTYTKVNGGYKVCFANKVYYIPQIPSVEKHIYERDGVYRISVKVYDEKSSLADIRYLQTLESAKDKLDVLEQVYLLEYYMKHDNSSIGWEEITNK